MWEVEAVQRFEAHNRWRWRSDAESRTRRRARHDIDSDEQDHGRCEQRRHKQGQPCEKEARHLRRLSELKKRIHLVTAPRTRVSLLRRHSASSAQLSKQESFNVLRKPVRKGVN